MRVIEGSLRLKGNEKVAIINGRFNHIITDRLVEGAKDSFKRHGGNEENLDLILVPGAFEIPFALEKALSSGKYDAVCCVGAVIRGATPHFNIGDIPTMTDKGTFIVNGAERVIVSQIVRSPGVYYKREISPAGKRLYNATMIPNRGAWLKFETDSNDLIYVKIDKNRKILATTLLKAMGITVSEMESLFTHFEFLKKTLDKDTAETTDDALIEVYKKLRPGDPASAAGGRSILEARFFDEKKYDIGRVGRYKLNKKLNLNIPKNQRTLTVEDIVSTIEYLINLTYDEGQLDDIDHLGNRRIRSVGELLQNQFRVGLSRIERIVKERMTLQDSETLTPY